MITIRNVSKSFGVAKALSGVSMDIADGKTTILLGARGAGKTALADVLCGVSIPDEGEIQIDGHDLINEPAEAKRRIGYLPENAAVYRDMTPRGHLKFVGQAREMRARAVSEAVEKVLAQTKLQEVANTPIRQLSPAYIKRVGIAQAIVGETSALVLDSPSESMDAKQIFELREIIRELKGKFALLILTESLTEAEQLGDTIYVLNEGRIVGKCAPGALAEMEIDGDSTAVLCMGGEEAVREAAKKAGSPCETLSADAGCVRAKLHTGKDPEARIAVFRAFAEANLPIIEMRPEKLPIRDIVMKLSNEPIPYAESLDAAKEEADKR